MSDGGFLLIEALLLGIGLLAAGLTEVRFSATGGI